MKTKIKSRVATVIATILIGAPILFLGTYGSRGCPRCSLQSIGANDMRTPDSFSTSYQVARQLFLEAAQDGGGRVENYLNPEVGPQGESLFTDVARFGPDGANTIIALISGTHGVEGFAGSGMQTRLLREGIASRLPAGTALLMIHGINPYGMAHLRRFNEDNVDLNRNFRDHTERPDGNPDYENLADVLAPPSISFGAEVRSWARIIWYRLTAGLDRAQAAVQGGQYSHPEGLFYGGTSDVWSNTTLRSIAGRYLSNAARVVVVDVHTGLGEFGSAEIILNDSATAPNVQRAVAIWGPDRVRATITDRSVSTHLDASLKLAFTKMLPGVEVTAVSLEFGTLPPMDVFKAVRAENWLHQHGGADHPKAAQIKACLVRAFHPESDEWETLVWNHGRDVIEKVLEWVSR